MSSGSIKRVAEPAFIVECGTFSSSNAEQYFNIGYDSREYALISLIINTNTMCWASPYITDVELMSDGRLYVKRTSAGAYAGAVCKVCLQKM